MSRKVLASTRIRAFTAALGLAIAAPATAQVPVGDFYFFDRSGDGRQQASITTLAEENPVKGAGGLTWACEAGEGRLIVSSTYLGRSMRARVRWAFDGEEFGDTESWILRRTGMAVIAPPEIASEFTRRALQARRVVIQASDYQFRRHSYTFSLVGLEEALSMLPCDFTGSQASISRPTVLLARQTEVSAAP
ncbi:MAG: hypothetical protein P8049_06260 [Gemmatimonadota bacterium]